MGSPAQGRGVAPVFWGWGLRKGPGPRARPGAKHNSCRACLLCKFGLGMSHVRGVRQSSIGNHGIRVQTGLNEVRQRRQLAERKRLGRATDARVLEDAERLIAV